MDPMVGRIVLDRYEVLRRVGSGGMGAVYVARQLAVGREVALKILRGDLANNEAVRERFRREAEIIGKLRHPNTIQLIDYGETEDGLAVIVMELLVGLALSDRLKQLGPMAVLDATRIGMQIAQSLAEAHGVGLVHRDLKPANIFLVEVAGQTHAKVLDFGIARILDEEATRLTADGQVFGTPRYMSPEQGMATGEVDARTDLYSLGLIIFECLVGQPPFVAQTSIQYLSAHATLPPPKLSEHLPDAPASLEALIDACLVKERADRIQSADAVAEALRRITLQIESGADEPTQVPPEGSAVTPNHDSLVDLLPERPATADPVPQETSAPLTAMPPARTSNTVVLAGAVAAILAGLILVAIFALGPQTDDPPTTRGHTPDAAPAVAVAPLDEPPPPPATPDAGVVATPVEAPPRVVENDPPKPKIRRPRRPTKRKPAEDPTLPGAGALTGPRGLNIMVDEIDETILEAAKRCKASTLPDGEATLTVESCKAGCAVMVDGACAGRTPVTGLSMPVGNKTVSIVCGADVAVERVLRLRAGKPGSIRCN